MESYQGSARYKPLTAWQYFWLSVLFTVPVVGFVFLIVFSFNSSNINRRSFARSYWCKLAITLIVLGILILIAVLTGSFGALGDAVANAFEPIIL